MSFYSFYSILPCGTGVKGIALVVFLNYAAEMYKRIMNEPQGF